MGTATACICSVFPLPSGQSFQIVARENDRPHMPVLLQASHSGIPQAVVLFILCEHTLDCLFSLRVDLLPVLCVPDLFRLFHVLCPDMPEHLFLAASSIGCTCHGTGRCCSHADRSCSACSPGGPSSHSSAPCRAGTGSGPAALHRHTRISGRNRPWSSAACMGSTASCPCSRIARAIAGVLYPESRQIRS
jgi:hypothetical protein